MHTHSLIRFVHPLIELICFALLVGVSDARCCLNDPCCAGVDVPKHVYEAFVKRLTDDCSHGQI